MANVAGGVLVIAAAGRGKTAQRLLIAFGSGFMLAVAVLAMLPHALEQSPNAALVVLLGYLLVHVTQHVVTPHFHFGEETHHEAMIGPWVGVAALLGLLVHTFFDGVAIASGFTVSHTLGVLIFAAVFLHKIPAGATLASVMLASGNGARRTLGGVVLLGVSTVFGVLLTGQMSALRRYGLPLSAGVTLYVAASNLIPEVQRERGAGTGAAVIVGVVVFYLTEQLLGG